MLAKYLLTFVFEIVIFIVFCAQYSNGLQCFGDCSTVVLDVANPPTPPDGCLDTTTGTGGGAQITKTCDAGENETSCIFLMVLSKTSDDPNDDPVISKTIYRHCADPTKGVWFLSERPFKPNTCFNVEDGDKITELKGASKKLTKSSTDLVSKNLGKLEMAHVCFCQGTQLCDIRVPEWSDEKLLQYFKKLGNPTTTGKPGEILSNNDNNTCKVKVFPTIIFIFLTVAASSFLSPVVLFVF